MRLTTRRVESANPLILEILAEKDQLRAQFAISVCRLELTIGRLKETTTRQMAELGRKTDTINRLNIQLGEHAAAIVALRHALMEQLQATKENASADDDLYESPEVPTAAAQRHLSLVTDRLRESA